MYTVFAAFALIGAATAFAPAGRVASKSSLSMALGPNAQNLVGSDIEFPEFDPAGISLKATPAQMAQYRAAELKHGRIAMLAALGQLWTGGLFGAAFGVIQDPVFSQGAKPLAALAQVWEERPFAIIQIVALLSWLEIRLLNKKAQLGEPAGDFNWDPLGLRPSDPETWEKVQLRELKNGRLAMIAISGMLVAEATNGLGVVEMWQLGKANPF